MAFLGTQQKCKSCEKTVYMMDQLTTDGVVYHKSCFKCNHCKGTLKVDASPDLLKPINVGKSSVLKVGQQCLAIGNPFGFDQGGGPLLDSKGNLIGINTAIFTQTERRIGRRRVAGGSGWGDGDGEESALLAQRVLVRVFERILRVEEEKTVEGEGAGAGVEKEIQGLVMCRLLAPSSQVGCMLGKGGEIVEKIKQESEVQISVLSAGSTEGNGDRLRTRPIPAAAAEMARAFFQRDLSKPIFLEDEEESA
ncbi:hypothetical protein Taro_022682 [Colocasia esculenta]|uniref:LIM zinc-binding domain-containing protein n=1 Tax=Colocasia esculenta TaxID=4460 RepID=A0A843V4D9_COLES|nr:hypothetical protein [Colocasia esculenta]